MGRHARVPEPLCDRRRKLAEQPEALEIARRAARRRGRRNPALADEYESAALVAVAEAAATYPFGAGVAFERYLRRRVRWSLIDCERAWLPLGFRMKSCRAGMPAVGLLGRVDLPEAAEPVGYGVEYHDLLDVLTRPLPVGHRTLIRALYGRAGCDSRRSAAKAIGISKTMAAIWHDEAGAMIRGGTGAC
jgi:hypothetical protein